MIKVNLMTSFVISGGYKRAAEHLNNNIPENVGVELYGFFMDDFRRMAKIRGDLINDALLNFTTAEIMASLHDRPEAVEWLANDIVQTFNGVNIQIFSIATYIPDLLKVNDKKRQEFGKNALKFIMIVTAKINEIYLAQNKPGLSVIELVAGNLTEDFHALNYSHDDAQATIRLWEPQQAFDILLSALNDVMQIKFAGESNLRLAIELEPGPFFALKNQAALSLLVKSIKEYEDHELLPKNRVGLNLDIAHWSLAGLGPDDIPGSVGKRILHAHISDHGIGHLGDAGVGTVPRGQHPPGASASEWL
ncbi:MAG: TIM barrel protein [Kiritimatiellia bacterium]